MRPFSFDLWYYHLNSEPELKRSFEFNTGQVDRHGVHHQRNTHALTICIVKVVLSPIYFCVIRTAQCHIISFLNGTPGLPHR